MNWASIEGIRRELDEETVEGALVEAARRGRTDIIKQLLAAGVGADANEGSREPTALLAAVSRGYLDVVTQLLAAGADARYVPHGYTDALNSARSNGDVAIYRALLGADPRLLQWVLEFSTPKNLLRGIEEPSQPMRDVLEHDLVALGLEIPSLELPADARKYLEKRTDTHNRLDGEMEAACRALDLEAVAGLLAQGADLNRVSGVSFSPVALCLDSAPLVLYLLERGADPNFGGIQCDEVRRPLVSAVACYYLESARLLATFGADLSLDAGGVPPAQAALGSWSPDRAPMVIWLYEEGVRQSKVNGRPLHEVFGITTPILRWFQKLYDEPQKKPFADLR